MNLRVPAIVVAARSHGETAVIARLLTEDAGLVAAYIAGGRGRNLRPVVVPGNLVEADIRSKSDTQLPFARVELTTSRGPWLTEPLASAAILWVTSLTASVLPERNPYPALYRTLVAVLDAICAAPSARGWLPALVAYERLLLRELGYGGANIRERHGEPSRSMVGVGANGYYQAVFVRFEKLGPAIENYLLADVRGDVMAARNLLGARLKRMLT
ncbi:DNA recombination protein RecO [Altererythrobacter aurantiacus]|uniref:DNA repair protein RecO n=1 Tax=Parapontixanthobacter aurantiacus TaxID=1463599 RepID=A0A844ZCL9_9SPHN|nr:recombination protein O N-terminal domain-containing protein [Parapontixanthobacter aurantiacus]MXO85635.1 DNA recombination protein RecO [Parapontixanthobacter aurantiacus]